jgi:hypothetical protein
MGRLISGLISSKRCFGLTDDAGAMRERILFKDGPHPASGFPMNRHNFGIDVHAAIVTTAAANVHERAHT